MTFLDRRTYPFRCLSGLFFAAQVLAASVAQAQTQVPVNPRLIQGLSMSTQGVSSMVAAPTSPPVISEAPPVPDAQVVETALVDGPQPFGHWLFRGRFAQESFQGFNPDYAIGVGDTLDVRLWGAFVLETQLQVDAQGNIFIPSVGPVRVTNVRNGDLNTVVSSAVKRVYRENVGIYATLAASQPVKVFVSGGVRQPGLYGAFASDSLLHFLDRAGGIEPKAGSYLDVRVLRGDEEVTRVNLYEFLLSGRLPLIQLRDGDTIFVAPQKSTVSITGLVATSARYEFDNPLSVQALLKMAAVSSRATHVRLTRNRGERRTASYLPIDEELAAYMLLSGDEVEVVADRLTGQIVVLVEGEHQGRGQYVLPYEARLSDLLEQMQFSPQSLRSGLQLYRTSIASRQKQMLDEMLDKLEASVFSARSTTVEEAGLRTQEANLIERFIERARKIEPKGQLILPSDVDPTLIALEEGDVIRIPRISPTIAVHGEVFFPTNFIHSDGLGVRDYIDMAGGLTQSSDAERVIVLKPNGAMTIVKARGYFSNPSIEPGDEILVLPKVQEKTFQFRKDVIEVIYQIAIAAGVVLRL